MMFFVSASALAHAVAVVVVRDVSCPNYISGAPAGLLADLY